jgi:hypothetical protein
MARRSKIKTQVPANIREEFEAELVAGGFSDYQGLTNWLNERLKAEGIDMKVSVMAANRYGKSFQESFERDMAEANQTYRIAKVAMANNEDTEGVVRDATIRTLQTRLLRLSSALREAEEADDNPYQMAETTAKIAKALADLGRVEIASQKYKAELEEAVYKARMDVIKRLRDFIAEKFPDMKKAFAVVLKPFAEMLANG